MLTLAAVSSMVIGSAQALSNKESPANQPPALTPFADNDPIPKLELRPLAVLNSSRDVAESFLALMSVGYDPSVESHAGGTVIGGDWQGYEKAWELMGDSRPSFSEFQAQWAGTIRIGLIQLEPITPNLFFVELERVSWYEDHWAVSYFVGTLETTQTGEGWRISDWTMCTENLAQPNIIGHRSWHQDDVALASVLAGFKSGEYEVVTRRYGRRTGLMRLRHKTTGDEKAFRMARVVEGSWYILEPGRGPICGD